MEERVNTRPKAQSRTTNGTEGQVDEAGSDLTEGWIQFGSATRFPMDRSVAGPSSTGLAEDLSGVKRAEGLFCKALQRVKF